MGSGKEKSEGERVFSLLCTKGSVGVGRRIERDSGGSQRGGKSPYKVYGRNGRSDSRPRLFPTQGRLRRETSCYRDKGRLDLRTLESLFKVR